MTGREIKHSTSKKPVSRGRRGRLYTFCVVALAAFLVALALGRSHTGSFKATAVLLAPGAQPNLGDFDLDRVRHELLDAARLDEAITDVAAREELRVPPEQLAALRDGISVTRYSGLQPGQYGISISCVSRDERIATALANHISDSFVQRQALAGASAEADQYGRAAELVAAAEDAVTAAKANLDNFLAAHPEINDPPATPATDQPPVEPEIDPVTANIESPAATAPEVAALESKLNERRQQLDLLLQEMKPEHPLVVNLKYVIADLEGQLLAVRPQRTDAEQQSQIGPDFDLDDDPIVEPAMEVDENLLAEHERLVLAYQAALEDRSRAAAEEHRQWAGKFETKPTQIWHVDAASAAKRLPAPTTLPLVMFGTILGLIAGGGFLFASASPSIINTVADAESALSVPSVGTVPEPHGSVRPEPETPFSIRLVILCAETILFVFLLAMILASLLDKDFGIQMRSDPLSALADGVRRFLEVLWR